VSETVKETKAQRAERLKRELNPWEASRKPALRPQGHASIPPEWGTYFRWWGVYSQGDGVGAVGGRGGEGKSTPYFMVRIRIPNGALAAHQVRAIADLAERHARGVADLTVRQNVQLHWVTIEDLPTVLETLWRTGITTLGACGDVTRNVTGCPVAGVDADELVDASPLVHAATRMLNGNPDFYNLPRKYKVTSPAAAAGALSRDQRSGADCRASPRHRRGRLLRACGRRPVHRPPSGSAARRLRALAGSAAGRARRVRAVPRQ
jgi:sulfite reductase (ferredoxin)